MPNCSHLQLRWPSPRPNTQVRPTNCRLWVPKLTMPCLQVEERCLDCNVTETPLWRWDPYFNHGVRRVCNRCGCKAARSLRKQTEQNETSPNKRPR